MLWSLQAEPISAQVDAYMGWMAEFNSDFVMIAASRSFIQQGGHSLDIPRSGSDAVMSMQQRQHDRNLAVQNRQCWKCDLDKYFPGGPVQGAVSFRHRVLLASLLVFGAGIATATAIGSRVVRRRCNCHWLSAMSACKTSVRPPHGTLRH
eukprot:COSAG02_NODE_8_length_60691_cov_104.994752_22_plen_150_part_00